MPLCTSPAEFCSSSWGSLKTGSPISKLLTALTHGKRPRRSPKDSLNSSKPIWIRPSQQCDAQLKAHPHDSFLHYLKAEILSQKGGDPDTPEFRQAVAAAAEAVRLKPDFVLARDVLGGLYLKSGQTAQRDRAMPPGAP